jgi:hypothetical protein
MPNYYDEYYDYYDDPSDDLWGFMTNHPILGIICGLFIICASPALAVYALLFGS